MSEIRECHYGHRDDCEKVHDMQRILKLLAARDCDETKPCLPCLAQEVLQKYDETWEVK